MKDYQNLWDTAVITNKDSVLKAASLALKGKERYEKVVEGTKVPWYFVAAIHYRESTCNFNRHLHNGDPLTARTTHVPAGRPVDGKPPFTWEESAKDALFNLKNFDAYNDWDIPSMLYRLEAYNGWGYDHRGLNSPYVWSGTNHYTKGKYVADGHFDANVKDSQMGTMPIIRYLTDKTLELV